MRPGEQHMREALGLAERGYGGVHPNPMVGAVLVRGGAVISTGFHRKFGGPHAERDCLRKAGARAKGGTLFVNLEPCIHHGKTPPCVDAIIAAGVSEVVVAMRDPNPMVSGRGLSALRRAGIRVSTGLLGAEARKLNARFIWWHTRGTPYVGLKWAQSLDGYVADTRGRSQWITGTDARRYAHYLRAGYHGLLVGAGTVLADDPRLTVRHVKGRDPVRIVLDGRLRVSGNERVFRNRGGRTIVVTRGQAVRSPKAAVRRLLSRGVDVMGIGTGVRLSPSAVLKALAGEGITSVLVEGGPATVSGFYEARAFNIYHVFVHAALMGGGLPALRGDSAAVMRNLRRTRGTDLLMFDDGDFLVEGGPA